MRRQAQLVALAALAVLVALGLAACGDDDPTAPDPAADGIVDVPGEVATLAEAITRAAAGDTIRLAQGAFEGTATIGKPLVITAARLDVSWPILDTTDGPLAIVLDGGTVELRGLALTGGETALAVELTDAELRAEGLHLSGATHGMTVDGEGGSVDLDNVTFLDCGTIVGSGGGLRIWGGNIVRVRDGRFHKQDLDGGMAATVSDSSDLYLSHVAVEDHDATGSAAVACSGRARLAMNGVSFHRGAGTMVAASGEASAMTDILLDGCNGNLIFLDSEDDQLQISGLRAVGCTGTVVDLEPGQDVLLRESLVSDHTGTAFRVSADATLDLVDVTLEDLSGGLASVLAGGELGLVRCLGVDVATPAVVGDVMSIEDTDLWRSDQTDAWVDLEAFAGTNGNIEADPLFCARAQGDFRLQPGTPCLLPDDSVMGAYGVGCE